LWLEYPGDRRLLRDFFFDACKCTHYWVAPNTFQRGRPDNVEREHYGIHNDNNLISIRERSFASNVYEHDVSIWFTCNKVDYWDWKRDVVESSIRWMLQSPGDALLDQDGGPLLGRGGKGSIIVSDQVGIPKKGAKHKHARRELEIIATTLDRECVLLERGHLPHF
jgi:hypothetical protein